LYAVMHVLKVIEERGTLIESPLLFYVAIPVLKVIQGETYVDWELIAFYT
jgi:hypothetical protein